MSIFFQVWFDILNERKVALYSEYLTVPNGCETMQRVSVKIKSDLIGKWVYVRIADFSKMGYISFDDLRCGLPWYEDKIVERETSGLKVFLLFCRVLWVNYVRLWKASKWLWKNLSSRKDALLSIPSLRLRVKWLTAVGVWDLVNGSVVSGIYLIAPFFWSQRFPNPRLPYIAHVTPVQVKFKMIIR